MIKYSDNTFFVIEDDYLYHEKGLLDLFNNDETIFRFLLEKQYLFKNSVNLYAFKFVGVITINDLLLCCLPKYYKKSYINFTLASECLMLEFSDIIKILKRIEKRHELLDSSLSNQNLDQNPSEIVLADFILKDFIENGVFEKNKKIINQNSDGEIEWNYTIDYTDPIFSKGRPIYHDLYSSNIFTENENIIKQIHKWAINYSYKKYHQILDYSFDYDKDCVNDICLLGSLDYLLMILKKELANAFIDRTIRLIKSLHLLLEKVYYQDENNFDLFGTGFFHVIWEQVNGTFFRNQIDIFQKYIPKPIWWDLKNNNLKKATLKPDIVTEQHGVIFLMDAKYYNLEYINNDGVLLINNNPGVGDITKQFLYKQALSKLNKPIYNYFIFPRIQQDVFMIEGYVTFPLFDSKIYNLFISPQRLFNLYLNDYKEELFKYLNCEIDEFK